MGETFCCTRFGIKKSPSSGVKEIFGARARSMISAVVSWVSLQKSFGRVISVNYRNSRNRRSGRRGLFLGHRHAQLRD